MLYIIGTPIGNLEDISLRALRILGEVDFVVCEDTRVTTKLLKHYEIKKPLISYHQHSDTKKIKEIITKLKDGKKIALVTDAGTPGISDPGGKLVAEVKKVFNGQADHIVEVIPGPSAITAALSVSGIPTDKFVFMGFPPHKKGRNKFIKKIITAEYPVVIYESKHRIVKFLEELTEAQKTITELNKKLNKKEQLKSIEPIVVFRELTKMHETIYRGQLKNIIEKIKTNPNDQKGEFVVVIGK